MSDLLESVQDADGVLTPFGMGVAQSYARAWLQGERDTMLEARYPDLDGLFYDMRNDADLTREHAGEVQKSLTDHMANVTARVHESSALADHLMDLIARTTYNDPPPQTTFSGLTPRHVLEQKPFQKAGQSLGDAWAVDDVLEKQLFIGPKGGKWADPAHTISYKEPHAVPHAAPRVGRSVRDDEVAYSFGEDPHAVRLKSVKLDTLPEGWALKGGEDIERTITAALGKLAPPPGHSIVYRLGAGSDTLAGKNAGNLAGVVSHLMETDDRGVQGGDTITAYAVRLPAQFDEYKRMAGGRATEAPSAPKKHEPETITPKDADEMLAGNLGVKRIDMPQIRSDLVSKFVDEIRAGGVAVKHGVWRKVGDLKATQSELHVEKVNDMLKREEADLQQPPIIVSKDDHILDGHHRWAALLTLGALKGIETISVDLPMKELLVRAKKFSGVEFKKADPLLVIPFQKASASGGPFIGPRGGKWADPAHTIPWDDDRGHGAKGKKADEPGKERTKKPDAPAHAREKKADEPAKPHTDKQEATGKERNATPADLPQAKGDKPEPQLTLPLNAKGKAGADPKKDDADMQPPKDEKKAPAREWVDHYKTPGYQTIDEHRLGRGNDDPRKGALAAAVYKPAREQMHDAWMSTFTTHLGQPIPPARGQKIAVVMMGGPASGKTSTAKHMLGIDDKISFGSQGYVNINPDDVKDLMPEFQEGVRKNAKDSAAMAHEESSDVAEKVLMSALQNGNHIVLDGTGKNADKHKSRIDMLKQAGYQVHLLMPDLDLDMAKQRAESRADKTGRYVPLHILDDAYPKIVANFEQVAQTADTFQLFDTRVGPPPVLRWKGGKDVAEEIPDPQWVTDFRQRAKGQMGTKPTEEPVKKADAPDEPEKPEEKRSGLGSEDEKSDPRYTALGEDAPQLDRALMMFNEGAKKPGKPGAKPTPPKK